MSSFTSEIKKEIIHLEMKECCYRAELAAIIRMNGLLSTTGRNETLDIQTESAAIARRIFMLVKANFDGPVELLVRKKMKLKKNNVYIVRVRHGVIELLQTLQIDHEQDGFEQTDLSLAYRNDCCKRSYLRGAFIARGSINNPETSSYHLEIFSLDQDHNHVLCHISTQY